MSTLRVNTVTKCVIQPRISSFFVAGILALSAALLGCTDTLVHSEQTEASTSNKVPHDVSQWVDPFIGTAGDRGQLHPAATVPFGMIQMGPETPGRPHSGYDFTSDVLEGFAHTRTAGVGCRGAGGSLLVRADYNVPERDESGALVPEVIHKNTELASVGYYSVEYGPDNIKAELTATPSTGWQRYTFPHSGRVSVTIDTLHAHHENYGGRFQYQGDGHLTGMVSGPTVCKEGRFQFHFSMRANKAPESVEPLDDYRIQYHYTVEAGEQVVFNTGISAVDSVVAEESRKVETSFQDFAGAKVAAQQAWNNALGKVVVSGSESQKRLFYTHLYHVYQSPSNLTASANRYRASNGKVYPKTSHNYYFGWSIWDTFRTKLPLLTILEPEVMADMTASIADLYSQNKQHWATEQAPLPTVRTEHSGIMLLDAWQKGIRSFDLNALLPKLMKEADGMPRTSPDQILEASYDDWAVGTFAQIAGNTELADFYIARASEYRSMWQERFKHVDDTFDIMHGDGLYEGTLWQYRWFAPFDMKWLVEELGGSTSFNQELTQFFDNELFNMGNQPDIQTPFIFSMTGQPWKSQQVVHGLVNTKMNHWYGTHEKKDTPYFGYAFEDSPFGLIPEMDNDAGTMSGWYVFTVMGLYPAVPGAPVYTLHTPQLQQIEITLSNNATFKIKTDKNPQTHPYIQSVTFNGANLENAYISHDDLINGGVLSFALSDEPNKTWSATNGYLSSLKYQGSEGTAASNTQ